jgi:heat shock protein HslJ
LTAPIDAKKVEVNDELFTFTTRLDPMKVLPICVCLFLVASLAVAGCVSEAPPAPAGKAVLGLPGTEWELETISVTSVNLVEGTKITLIFDEESLGGTAGCNHYFGSYSLDENRISIGGIGSTLMYCGDPGVMEQESLYLSILGEAASVRIDGDKLTLFDAAGAECLIFIGMKEEPPVVSALPKTEWQLQTIGSKDGTASSVVSGTSVTLVFDDEGVSGSAGCNRYFGSYTVHGNTISVGAIGSTKMHCGEAGVMDQEQRYIATLAEIVSFGIDSDRLTLFDEQGNVRLVFAFAPPEAPLTKTHWMLDSITEDTTVTQITGDRVITAVFDDVRISGTGGCNSYSAEYHIDGDEMTITDPIRTLVYCMPETLMELESRYFSLLPQMAGYTIDGDRLCLFSSDKKTILTFGVTANGP